MGMVEELKALLATEEGMKACENYWENIRKKKHFDRIQKEPFEFHSPSQTRVKSCWSTLPFNTSTINDTHYRRLQWPGDIHWPRTTRKAIHSN